MRITRLLQGFKNLRFLFSEDPQKWFLALNGNTVSSGVTVNEDSALRLAAVYSCVRVLAESVAQLPLKVYERLPSGGKREAAEHPLYPLVHDRPNEEIASFNWRETIMGHLCTWGNAYSFVDYANDGRVRSLKPLLPSRVAPKRTKTGLLVYEVADEKGQRTTYLKEQILHVAGLGYDGLIGYSPIRLAAESIGTGIAAAQFQGKFFANGALPGGVLEHKGTLGREAQDRLKESWERIHKGTDNAHKIAVLEEGMTYKSVTINPVDAQLLESMKLSRSEIAGIYRVPAHLINDLEKATFSNITELSLEFVMYTLSPWLTRLEQAMNWRLFLPSERGRYFCEFVVDGLLRGDTKSRNEAHRTAIMGGWKSINEVRAEENMAPIEGGDEHFMQSAFTTVGRIVNPDPADPQGGGGR